MFGVCFSVAAKKNLCKRGGWNFDEAFHFVGCVRLVELRAPFELGDADGKLDADTSRVRGYCAGSHDVGLNARPW